jgi:acetylornithine/succinyldiaminopimelate/putrescine aminotransferase
MLTRESASVFHLGDHGTTLGGNPLTAAAALATLRVLDAEHLMDNARVMGARFADGLDSLVPDGLATEVRGRGLMIGLETAGPIARRTMAVARDEFALLVNATGDTTLRIVPPLTITAEEVDEGVSRLRAALTRAAEA